MMAKGSTCRYIVSFPAIFCASTPSFQATYIVPVKKVGAVIAQERVIDEIDEVEPNRNCTRNG